MLSSDTTVWQPLVRSAGVAAAETCGRKISEITTVCYWLRIQHSANSRQLYVEISYGHRFLQQLHPRIVQVSLSFNKRNEFIFLGKMFPYREFAILCSQPSHDPHSIFTLHCTDALVIKHFLFFLDKLLESRHLAARTQRWMVFWIFKHGQWAMDTLYTRYFAATLPENVPSVPPRCPYLVMMILGRKRRTGS